MARFRELDRIMARFWEVSQGAKREDLAKAVWRSRTMPAEDAHCGLLMAKVYQKSP